MIVWVGYLAGFLAFFWLCGLSFACWKCSSSGIRSSYRREMESQMAEMEAAHKRQDLAFQDFLERAKSYLGRITARQRTNGQRIQAGSEGNSLQNDLAYLLRDPGEG